MKITLARATEEDAEKLHKMQIYSFAELFERYQDFDTNPANEPLEKTLFRLRQQSTYYYFIYADSEAVGAIRIVDDKSENPKKISPLFILPEFRGKGIAQEAITLCEKIHGSENWSLDTILQEKGNCHLYEKMGYKQTDNTEVINDKMTLVFYEK